MQKQNLNCADARHFIHLSVGDDNLPEEETQLARHLHSCSECRSYHAGMVDAMQVVERVRDEDVAESPTRSLWPAMAAQLNVRQAKLISEPEGRRFNVAVAALCVCSLMLAIVTAVQNLPTNSQQITDVYQVMPSMNAGFTNQPSSQNFGAASPQSRVVEVSGPNGSRAWVDTATGQLMVPHVANSTDENLNF